MLYVDLHEAAYSKAAKQKVRCGVSGLGQSRAGSGGQLGSRRRNPPPALPSVSLIRARKPAFAYGYRQMSEWFRTMGFSLVRARAHGTRQVGILKEKNVCYGLYFM
ncbi:hypothetical protein [Halomonas sp.]|uniref:hypothetical protein n=1 Tax=Halomonas sp. TaxID=1486246 RepID=UPI00384F8F71